MKFNIKPILISIVVVFVVVFLSIGAIKGNAYLQVKGSVYQASELASEGKYQEASKELQGLNGKWLSNDLKKELENGKKEYKELEVSNSNFDKGRRAFDEKNYNNAVRYFKKVLFMDVNYNSAKKWIAMAEEKLLEGDEKPTTSKYTASESAPTVYLTDETSQSIQTPSDQQDNSRYAAIKNLFTRLGQLQGSLGVQEVLLNDASQNSVNCEEKYGKQYLSSGALNPNFIMTPSTQAQVIQSCQSGSSSVYSQISTIKAEMNNVRKEILEIASNCSSKECTSALEALTQLELQGIF